MVSSELSNRDISTECDTALVVIVKLRGGLGNQLFQYAAGRSLAVFHGTDLKLDTTAYLDNDMRRYELRHFLIKEEFATSEEIATFMGHENNALNKLLNAFKPYYKHSVFKERQFSFDPNFLRTRRNVYLDGYWQSEKYFRDIRNLLCQEFSLKRAPHRRTRDWAEKIVQHRSVSIHVRRGDFIADPDTHRIHGVCSVEYYRDAVKLLSAIIDKPYFFIFSDDQDWAYRNLDFGFERTVVSDKDSLAHEELWLMSLCNHNIVANSSFSWWGAWLNNNPGKIVVAPKQWVSQSDLDTSDRVPQPWIRL